MKRGYNDIAQDGYHEGDDKGPAATAMMLYRYGVVTVPVFPDTYVRQQWENKVWKAMDTFPEYKKSEGQQDGGRYIQRVLGGFGALANPSSFHHPVLQELRRNVKSVTAPILREYVRVLGWDPSQVNYEMLFDRLCVRYKGFGSVSKESWHRDVYDGAAFGLRSLPCSLPDGRQDEIFGGWVNLSAEKQKFVCQVGSHRGEDAVRAREEGGGFALADGKHAKVMLAQQANRKIGSLCFDKDGYVVVPPGHLILFPQSILHAVMAKASPPRPNLRLFLGHRLTCEQTSLFPDLTSTIDENAVPRIPSGQLPPMFSANHFAFFSKSERFRRWGEETFVPACLFKRTTPSGEVYYTPGNPDESWLNKGNVRAMPSLTAIEDLLPYAYTPETKAILFPEALE